MALAGWSWNLLNLMALPLVLGTGVDYGIFMQLALRRHGGDVRLVRRSVGRALLLCGGTAIAGFGSLAWSGNAGMASLGKVCAVGIGANMLIAVYLLPAWWRRGCARSPRSEVQRRTKPQSGPECATRAQHAPLFVLPARPVAVWAGGRSHGSHLAGSGCCVLAAELHLSHSALAPGGGHSEPAAGGRGRIGCWRRQTARRLYRNFGLKLADLWRVESGRARA